MGDNNINLNDSPIKLEASKKNSKVITQDNTYIKEQEYKNKKEKSHILIGNIKSNLISTIFPKLSKSPEEYFQLANKWEIETIKAINTIPKENLTNPSLNIVGEVTDSLKYNLEEEHIKEAFTKLLVADMDKTIKNKVHPGFIQVIKELTPSDVNLLNVLKEADYLDRFAAIKITARTSNESGFIEISPLLTVQYKNNEESYRVIEIQNINLDNLKRLNIFEVPHDTYFPKALKYYEEWFNLLKDEYSKNTKYALLEYKKLAVFCTDFGKDLLDICFNN